MNYKKAYKEALIKAQDMLPYNRKDIEYLFPEFKDERIRKTLIDFFSKGAGYGASTNNIPDKEIIDWLERQGKKSQFNVFKDNKERADNIKPKFKKGDKIHRIGESEPLTIIEVRNDYYVTNSVMLNGVIPFSDEDNWEFIDLKVGNWRINNTDGLVYKITHVLDNGMCKYKTIDGKEYTSTQIILQLNSRPWTINDAKKGDVLCTNDNSIFIFDGTLYAVKYPYAYCGIVKDKFQISTRIKPFTCIDVFPANKEQQTILFKKMHQSGFEWDDKNKRLKKIMS